MFSRRVVPHALTAFGATAFEEMIEELRSSRHAGYQIMAHNVA